MIKKYFELLLSIPKTLYVNFRCLPFPQAIKLPILIGYSTKIDSLKGKIVIEKSNGIFSIRINWGGTKSRDIGAPGYLFLGEKSSLVFSGKAIFGKGTSIIVDSGKMQVGDNFFCNRNCCISCNDHIVIGDDAMWGWNVELLDSDNHEYSIDDRIKKSKAPIIIGKHVWLASYVHVLKDSKIGDNSIVSYRSTVRGNIDSENALYGGFPAIKLKDNIIWSRSLSNNMGRTM